MASRMALQIIGSGFGRTGTMSMKHALEQLGFPCYHMVECLPRGPSHWKLWEEAHQGKPQWDMLFDGFAATVDFPASTSFAALAEYYPEAKVIHTVRDPEKWFVSTQSTIFGFEVSQGWEPLCEFLGLPVPNGEFPNVNDTAAVQGLLRTVMENGFRETLGYTG